MDFEKLLDLVLPDLCEGGECKAVQPQKRGGSDKAVSRDIRDDDIRVCPSVPGVAMFTI